MGILLFMVDNGGYNGYNYNCYTMNNGGGLVIPEFLLYIHRFKQFYTQSFQPLAKQYGLTQLEIDILLFLHNNPAYNTARDIVERRGLAKSNVSNALESLRRKGYLSSQTDPDSRRVRRLQLRPDHGAVIEALAACQGKAVARLTDNFTREEREQLRALLDKTDKNITKAITHMQKEEGRPTR